MKSTLSKLDIDLLQCLAESSELHDSSMIMIMYTFCILIIQIKIELKIWNDSHYLYCILFIFIIDYIKI